MSEIKQNNQKILKEQFVKKAVLKYLAKDGFGDPKNKITDLDIIRAKSIPVESFYFGHLHKRGNILIGLCPFHNDQHHPNLNIYKKTNSFYCFACSAGGTVIDFMMKSRNCSFLEAVKYILKT